MPTLSFAGDFVHVNKWYRRGRDCRVGDMVVAAKPTDPAQFVSKRITGMPGDQILVDPSVNLDTYITVPQGHCWLTGDNLNVSLDSRSYGPLPLALIKGKIFAVNTTNGEFRWIENCFEDATNDNS